MIGAVHKSYVRRVSVHTGFNRAFTIHGTHYLKLLENVAYNVKGHNVFIEDAIESHNYIYRNLVIGTIKSMSLLNTDQSPASFWITHPENDFIENHAAGSDNYGYWYDLQPHAMGPSANSNVCPTNSRVGKFRNNHAHSNGKYGFRIFHDMTPKKFPCKPLSDKNPFLETKIETLTSWKNGQDGAIAERIADVKFVDLRLADNIKAGIEVSFLEGGLGMSGVHNSTIINKSGNHERTGEGARGIITAKKEHFIVKNVEFFDFNEGAQAAFGTCTHCTQMNELSDDGFTTRTWNLTFVNSTRINQTFPKKAIFLDMDGTLTDLGPNSWATHFYQHLINDDCFEDKRMNGVVCKPNVTIRVLRLEGDDIRRRSIWIANMDDSTLAKYNGDEWKYRNDPENFAKIAYQELPNRCYTVPIVTGKKYFFHFDGKNHKSL